MQRVLRILSHLDLRHDECRRARISQGYKAGELQPHYLIQCQGYSLVLTGHERFSDGGRSWWWSGEYGAL